MTKFKLGLVFACQALFPLQPFASSVYNYDINYNNGSSMDATFNFDSKTNVISGISGTLTDSFGKTFSIDDTLEMATNSGVIYQHYSDGVYNYLFDYAASNIKPGIGNDPYFDINFEFRENIATGALTASNYSVYGYNWFREYENGSTTFTGIASETLTQVSEPASIAILLAGLVGFIVFNRKEKPEQVYARDYVELPTLLNI